MKKITLIIFLLASYISFSQDVLMQNGTVTQCTGTFYDSGGSTANYTSNESFVLKICPPTPGDIIQLNFTLFNTQLTRDIMTIYDGDSTGAPSLGSFSGGASNSPGLVQASAGNPSGCLTIEWISDGSGAGPGWAAGISCFTPCQTIVGSIDSTDPTLDTATNMVTADVSEVITFNGSATFSSSGAGATYTWDFGDGNMATGPSVTHAYATAGIYIVTLIVTDTNPNGCSSNPVRITALIGASGPGNPYVDAGPDVTIDCSLDCTDIRADFLEIGETNTYTVSQIPFVPPFPFQGLTNSLNPNIDDAWSTVENLPFDFCFFTNIETQFQVGSNGVIRFDVSPGDTSNGWQFSENLPNNTNATLGEANIFTPCHDIDPSVNTNEQIAWEIIGVSPNRVLAVSYYNVPMYSGACNNLLATHMAVFYETTNVIDIYIKNKPTCNSWNSGRAVVGIQNDAGTTAFVPPGRNTSNSPWTATDEAWRFTPAGPSIIDFAWLDAGGNVIGTTPTLSVCPTAPTTYTAQVIYTNCNGNIVTLTDDVTVTKDVPFTVDAGPDQNLCEGDPDIVLNADIGSATASYQWALGGTDLVGETNPTLTVSSPNSGTYTVTVTDQSCSLPESVVVTFFSNPVINPISDYMLCDDAVVDDFTEFDLSTRDAEAIGGQSNVTVSYHLSQADADNDVNPLPTLFTNTVNPQTIYVRIENSSNTPCFGTSTFDLIVTSGIVLNQPNDLVLCDDDSSNDGFASFDLSSQTSVVLGGLTGVALSYHLSQADADNNINPLTSPFTNTTNPQSIYVRVQDDVNTLCFTSLTYDLIVNPLPLTVVTSLVECDINGTGLTEFTMSEATSVILNGQTGMTVTYYLNLIDAQSGMGALSNAYTNVSNPQTVYVRIEDDVTNCYSITTLDLIVNPLPLANTPSVLEVCDDNTDGIASFNLTLRDAQVLNGQIGMVVTYHVSQSAADSGSGALTDPYTNTMAFFQTVFVRVEDSASGCFDTTTLDLMVNPLPVISVISDYALCDDNSSGDGQEFFDLTTKDGEASNGQANLNLSYHLTQADAISGMNALSSPYQNTSNPQTIYVLLTNTITGCSNTTSFNLVVNPLPFVSIPTVLAVCDDNVADGFTSIDLSVKDNEISGSDPLYIVNYYLTQSDADSGMNPLTIPYTNLSNPQTVYAGVVNSVTGCRATTTLELQVEQAPVAFVPAPLEYCDADSDGFGVFTLTDAESQITGGASGLTVTYHETMADAQNDVNAQTSPYNNIVAYMQTIYVRVESATITTDCATIVALVLIVNDTPQIEDPTPLQVCDDNADGFAQFDLTSKNTEVLDGLDPLQYTVSYYEQQADANVPINAIATPNAYTNTIAFNQTLWVRVEDANNGCHKLTTLDLVVNALPVLVQPTPLTLCDVNNPGDQMEAFTLEDANAEILNGQTGITLTYYATQADADAGTNPISSPYVNTSNAQTIYVRAVTNTTGCVSTITLDLRVNPLPSAVTASPINECDGDNDGFASFDLEIRTLQIINGEMNISVTYHETMADADGGQNALTSPYDNIVANSQTVFARKENTLTGCYRVILLTLNVLSSPVVPTNIPDYVICDTNDDGFAQFDLTTKSAEILGTQDPAQYVLTYHTSQANANAGTSPIVNLSNYTNVTNPQTIYVRLVGGNGCIKTGQFEIRVELPPIAVQPTPLSLCDDAVADEMTSFDLTVKDNEITGGNASWSVSYYTTNADAQSDTNAIAPATDYINMSVGGNPANPQTLYVRVTDTDTGCTDFTTLTIRVLPNPTPSLDPSEMELCDDINTGDGQEVFDLTANEVYILNGELGVSATYHETPEDAESGMNAIVDPTMYTNTNTDNTAQTIYVRVTNNITGCHTVVSFTIIVNPLPEVVAVTDYIVCEVNTDGFAQFDLTSKDAEVLNGQDPSQFTVTYHATQMGADNLTGALLSPYTNTGNPQQIFVAITNMVTGCSISTPSFNLEVDNGAEANSDQAPIEQVECDYLGDNDGLAQFDLTQNDAEVLDGQDAVNFIVTYYATQGDAELGVNPIPYLYENISNPQVIYVRVDNDTPDALGMDSSICYAVAEVTLRVDLLPIFELDDSYTLCVATNGTEVIDPPVLETGLSPGGYTFVWSLDGVVLSGETGSSLSATQDGTYGVEITNIVTGCINTDTAEVVSSSPPMVSIEVATQAFSENHVIVATATGNGDYEYSLDGGPWQASGTFGDVSSGEHTVTARDINGCGEASDTVMVLDYPHFFTPNGDGRNDTWNIVGFADQPSAKIYIFDRFGKLLKQISPSGQGWDGTYNGRPMPSSDYWFTVEYREPSSAEPKQFRAHFTLKR
jgi:gliding motility-associated-like protein